MLILLKIIRLFFGIIFCFQVITMFPAVFMDFNGELLAKLLMKGIVAVIALAIYIFCGKGIKKLQEED